LRAAITNVPIGNGDAHAKNFALPSAPDGRRLAPFCDVFSSELFPLLSPTFAMRFGYAGRAAALCAANLARLEKDFGVTPALVRGEMDEVLDRVRSNLQTMLHDAAMRAGESRDVLTRPEALADERVTRTQGLA
jgi:serine/threonine-protein kinase HipA